MANQKQNPKYAIYILIDPRDHSIRYVGISNNVNRRFRQHIQITGENSLKDAWIRELLEQGMLPDLAILETVEDMNEARARERYWVDILNKKHDLLNWNLNEAVRNGGTRIDLFVPEELMERDEA